jgi:peroxiredoxin
MQPRHLLSLSIVLILIGLGMFFATNRLRADPNPAPAWQLKDLDGKTVKLSDFKGKVVILDFWATWCPPCREEIPNFVALQTQYKNQGLVVIGVSVDQGGPGVVSSFVKNNGINYPIVMATDDVTAQYGGIDAIPTTFVIDPQGNIVDKYVGGTDKSTFEHDIKKLLPAKT